MDDQNPSYAAIHSFLQSADWNERPPLRLTILRNIVIDGIEPFLRYLGWHAGYDVQLRMGGYDTVVSEALNGDGGLFADDVHGILVFCRLEGLSWDLARNFSALTPTQAETERDRLREQVAMILAGIRRQTSAPILWLGFERPIYPSMGAVDAQADPSQTRTILKLSADVMRLLSEAGAAYWIDADGCLARVGASEFYDQRYWHIGRAPYARGGLREISREIFCVLRAALGKNKKCLVLDCDNVLWGGVVGEAGIEGIKLGKTYPGSPYYELQQEILNLYHRGIILALCSKNNEEDVWEVFREHPDMLLREEHIAAARVNWDDKATNLRDLAEELNIGLDSMVLLEDSRFEAELVSELLPEVAVLHLPPERAVEYRDRLASSGMFDTLTVSNEDRRRGAMYRAEVQRRRLRQEMHGVDDYLRSLNMEIRLCLAGTFEAPRVAQLCQRTNQFNLTLRRHSEADIAALVSDPHADVVAVQLQDRFGDTGIVGAFIVNYQESVATIESFLLSCRVLGRGVERAMLSECLTLVRRRGCTLVEAPYVKGPKNQQVHDFYPSAGFEKARKEKDAVIFTRETSKPLPVPNVFATIDFQLDAQKGGSQ